MADRQLDVLFVTPNSSKKVYQGLAKDYAAIEVPVWSLLLAQSCRSAGFGVAILDCNAERLSDWQAIARIHEADPRLVVFVVYGSEPNAGTKNMTGAASLTKLLKQHFSEYKTCFVGSHVSALPGEVLQLSGVDYVCQNEGVYTLRSLLHSFRNHGEFDRKVRGLGYWYDRGDKKVSHLNLPSAIVRQENMDADLPGYAWDLVDLRKYRTHFWHGGYDHAKRSPAAALYTSLGCPYRCDFCMINILNRTDNRPGVTAADSNVFRYWSPKHTLNEITKLASMGVTNIRLSDEMFFLKQTHYAPLLHGITERFGDALNMWAYARVDTVKPNQLDLFRKAGVRWLCLGIESGNRIVRRQSAKGSYEDVDVKQVVQECHNAGIDIIANYIFGLPGDDYQSMNETQELALELDTAMYNAYPAMALPGSPLYQQAVEKGISLPDTYEGYSFHSYECLPLPTQHLTAGEVLSFRDRSFHEYWSRRSFLQKLEDKFGPAAKQNVQEMLNVRLRRKILGHAPPEDV